jgi:hypothetical protein
VKDLSAAAKAKVAEEAIFKLRQTIEVWETKTQTLMDEMAKNVNP